MCNGSPDKIRGIGTIKIKIYDKVLRTLIGVQHVPNLKKNPISLGELDTSACKFF